MRDPARIDRILDLVRELWMASPDQRFGQLLLNAMRKTGELPESGQLWNVEDTEWEARLKPKANLIEVLEAPEATEADDCQACEGPCINTDPEDYDHLFLDFLELQDHWVEQGVTGNAIWSFLGSLILSMASDSGQEWADIQSALYSAWKQGLSDDTTPELPEGD